MRHSWRSSSQFCCRSSSFDCSFATRRERASSVLCDGAGMLLPRGRQRAWTDWTNHTYFYFGCAPALLSARSVHTRYGPTAPTAYGTNSPSLAYHQIIYLVFSPTPSALQPSLPSQTRAVCTHAAMVCSRAQPQLKRITHQSRSIARRHCSACGAALSRIPQQAPFKPGIYTERRKSSLKLERTSASAA